MVKRYYSKTIGGPNGHIGIFDTQEHWGGTHKMIAMIPSGNTKDADMVVKAINKYG